MSRSVAGPELLPYARAEVAGLAVAGGDVWLATSVGLYSRRRREFIAAWRGRAIRAIAPMSEGLLLAVAEDTQTALFRCDAAGQPVQSFPAFPDSHVRCIAAFNGVLVGGKQGVFRLHNERYVPIHTEGNAVRLEAVNGEIRVFLKGQGPEDRPAVAVSNDGGQSWRLQWEGEYADQVQAMKGNRAVTRWRHLVRQGEPGHYQDMPAQAAYLGEDGLEAIFAGPELTIQGAGRAAVRICHPGFVDAEHLAWHDSRIILAGRPGAWEVEPATGAVVDLFAGDSLASNTGRIKQVFSLGRNRFLVTTISATFLTPDGGQTWRQVHSDWGVHHAKAVLSDGSGRFYLVCKGGLFQSEDDGASWEWLPVRPRTGHFGELTGGIVAGDRLVLASKRGLLVPSDEPGTWDWLGTLKAQKIKFLQVDASGRILGSLFDKREIHAIEPADGETHRVAVLPKEIEWFGHLGAAPVALTKSALYRLGDTQPVEMPLPETGDSWHGIHASDGVLIWNDSAAWVSNTVDRWRPIRNWPSRVKKAAVSSDGVTAMLTDGWTLSVLDLSDQSP